MSQATDWSVPLIGPCPPDEFAARIDDSFDALLSSHAGSTRPAYAVAGTAWVSTAVAGKLKYYVFDGTSDRLIQTIDTTTGAITYSDGITDDALPTAWARIGTPITLSGQAFVDWTNLGAYRHLRLTLECQVSASALALLRVSTNNGSSFLGGASDYSYSWLAQAGTNITGAALISASSMVLTNLAIDTSTQANITVDITNFNKALAATYKADSEYTTSAVTRREFPYGYTAGAVARNAIRLLTSAGNFANGQVTLEGIRG